MSGVRYAGRRAILVGWLDAEAGIELAFTNPSVNVARVQSFETLRGSEWFYYNRVMATKQTSTLERLASEAIRQGADAIEIEYKDGYEEVYFMKGGAGSGITLPSTSPEVRSLLRELHGIAKRGHRVTVDGCEYDLRVRIWDSFGEDAFRVSLRRLRSRSFCLWRLTLIRQPS
jgi:hypothetical protein